MSAEGLSAPAQICLGMNIPQVTYASALRAGVPAINNVLFSELFARLQCGFGTSLLSAVIKAS